LSLFRARPTSATPTPSLHDALPIYRGVLGDLRLEHPEQRADQPGDGRLRDERAADEAVGARQRGELAGHRDAGRVEVLDDDRDQRLGVRGRADVGDGHARLDADRDDLSRGRAEAHRELRREVEAHEPDEVAAAGRAAGGRDAAQGRRRHHTPPMPLCAATRARKRRCAPGLKRSKAGRRKGRAGTCTTTTPAPPLPPAPMGSPASRSTAKTKRRMASVIGITIGAEPNSWISATLARLWPSLPRAV